VGLTWVVAEAARARSAEFGEHGVFRRVWNWFAYWLGPPPANQTVMVGTATAHGRAIGTVSVQRAGESDMERLQPEFNELRERLARHEEDVSRRFAETESQTTQAARRLDERIGEIEGRQRDLRRSSLRQEVRGARLFILGAVLSAIANLV
jgi:hypothetical protein